LPPRLAIKQIENPVLKRMGDPTPAPSELTAMGQRGARERSQIDQGKAPSAFAEDYRKV